MSSRRGMKNMYEYKSGETKVVVTSDKLLINDVIKQAQKDKCPIVSIAWIQMCMHFHTILPYEVFKPLESFDQSSKKVEEVEESDKEIEIIDIEESAKDEGLAKKDIDVQEQPKILDESIEEPLKIENAARKEHKYTKIVKKLVSFHFTTFRLKKYLKRN